MNFTRLLLHFEHLLKLQHNYLRELQLKKSNVDKIKRSSQIIEKLAIALKTSSSNLKITAETVLALNNVRHLYEINKALIFAYRDISKECFENIKKEPWTYGKNGKGFNGGSVLYSNMA